MASRNVERNWLRGLKVGQAVLCLDIRFLEHQSHGADGFPTKMHSGKEDNLGDPRADLGAEAVGPIRPAAR